MAFNATALNNYTKHTYDAKYIDNSIISMSDPMLNAVSKKTDGSGRDFAWLADADDAFNASPDFPTAQNAANNNTQSVGLQFVANWNDLSSVAVLTASIIGKTRNDDGAWQKAFDVAQRKTLRGISHANMLFLLGKGWGEVSQITSVSGATFAPLIPSDITKYVRGMPLVFSQSLHSNGLRSATVLYVTGVNYTQGSELVTCSANLSTVSAANNDWCFIAGARQDSGTPTQIVPVGLNAWAPNQLTDLSDATVTTILTQDRTVNSRYYGIFMDAAQGGAAAGSLIDGVQELATIGNAKKTIDLWCSRNVFNSVAKDFVNQVRFDGNPAAKSVGTRKVLVYTDGSCEAYLNISRTMNDTCIFGFDSSNVVYKSIGGLPHIDSEDGLTLARQSSAAGYEVRWFQQSLIQVRDPVGVLRIQLV